MPTNFGAPGFQTSWYPLIEGMRTEGSIVIVKTGIFADNEGRREATPVCSGVSGYVFSNNQNFGLSGVEVRGLNEVVIVRRSNVSQAC